jgi:anti-sigma regulatory factor (Ser/Thr protein kinase)
MKRRISSENIREFIIDNVENNTNTISSLVSKKFKVSRQSVNRYILNLINEGLLKAEGNTRNRKYSLVPIVKKQFVFSVTTDLDEDLVWRQNLMPNLKELKSNIIDICHYGFTEILNNVRDHSESTTGSVELTLYPNRIVLFITDEGVGIFKKITKLLNLEDERHAVLELTKGKLTTDKAHHTGEGIFFTSRMFDYFSIYSGSLYFAHKQGVEENWLLQDEEKTKKGTSVEMYISTKSSRTINQVFDKYASPDNDYSFSRTHVPVALVRYGREQLVSRSQAKRLLARLEPFKEVFLNFEGVDFIGQAFADEIFRVYKNGHPDINIVWIRSNDKIDKMIKRVMSGSPNDDQFKMNI